jgi:hypothetical protein
MDSRTHQLDQARQVAARLERIPVDSIWARRASGLRGSLLRGIDLIERGASPRRVANLSRLIQQGFEILTQAAREIPDPNPARRA